MKMKKHYLGPYRDFMAVAELDVGGFFYHCRVTGPHPSMKFDLEAATLEEAEQEFHRRVDATIAFHENHGGWPPVAAGTAGPNGGEERP